MKIPFLVFFCKACNQQVCVKILNPLRLNVPFLYTPWKYQKTSGFLLFSGGIKMEHWDIKG